jgi:hypothetical protein
MVILFIASLNGQVFESAKILGNSFCYCRSEKNKRLINIWRENEGMVKVLW